MRKANYILLMMFIMIISCSFFFKGEAEAAELNFYKEYSMDRFETKERSIKLDAKCKLTVSVNCPYVPSDNEYEDEDEDDWYDVFDEIYISIGSKDKGREVFTDCIDDFGITKSTVTLPAGKYDLYIECGEKCIVTLWGEYIPEISPKKLTMEAGKSKTLKVSGTNQRVRWKSSNKSIATVSEKGVLKAKKSGKVIITASVGDKKLQCKVTVKASYNELSKKMKAFAKKNKNFTFQNVKYVLDGKKCRLYGKKTSETKITGAYGIMMESQPFIELRKSDKKTELSFRLFVQLWKVSYNDVTLSVSNIQVVTSNRKLKFKEDSGMSDIKYDYSTGCNIGHRQGEYTILKMNVKSLKKFESMLGQKSLKVKAKNYEGTNFQVGIDAGERKNWRKLLKEYRTLLKAY